MTTFSRSLVIAVTFACCGCSPPIPEVPATVSFPTGPGRVEIRKALGDIVGGIGDRHYRVDTSIVLVKLDGSEVPFQIHWASIHSRRALRSVALRGDGKSFLTSFHERPHQDVYVDSSAVSPAEFDTVAKSIQENFDAFEAAYLDMLECYDEPLLMSLNHYDVTMLEGKKYYWSQNSGVHFLHYGSSADLQLRVPLREQGPCVMWIGQITLDGQELLICDLTELEQHPYYSLSFKKALADTDLSSMIEECEDSNGNCLSDYFKITLIPANNCESRLKQEAQKLGAPASK